MYVSFRMSLTLCTALCFAVLGGAVAQAAPISVNLRVEGSSATLYEGPIATEAEEISTLSSGGAHPCDVKDDGSNEGFGVSSGTPTTALHDAAIADGLKFDATWSSTYKDFLVTEVGPDANGGPPEYPSWGYAVNYTTAGVGGCQFQVAPGSEVLWAYNYSNLQHLLSLSGPTNANVGSPVTLRVVDGQTGAPVAGAAIGEDVAGVTTTIPGSPSTNAEGNATVTLVHTGTVKLKATQPESVRSNGISVCVHDGNDGTCGTTLPGVVGVKDAPGTMHVTPVAGDTATIGGVKNGRRYSRRKGPRILQGLVQVPAGGTLREVRISLQRRNGKRCMVFSGTKEAFVRAHCGVRRFFPVGAAESFNYLLPASLPPGRYVYDIEAIDGTGDATKLVPGVSHVVFYVK
jgi:hypothetical protein